MITLTGELARQVEYVAREWLRAILTYSHNMEVLGFACAYTDDEEDEDCRYVGGDIQIASERTDHGLFSSRVALKILEQTGDLYDAFKQCSHSDDEYYDFIRNNLDISEWPAETVENLRKIFLEHWIYDTPPVVWPNSVIALVPSDTNDKAN